MREYIFKGRNVILYYEYNLQIEAFVISWH